MIIKRELGKLGFDAALLRRVAVAMYEAEVNMAIHAGGGEITVDVDDRKISVRLEDNGPGIPDVDKAMEEGFSTAPEDVQKFGFGAGMGLANMKRNCDALEIANRPEGGTAVTMVFLREG